MEAVGKAPWVSSIKDCISDLHSPEPDSSFPGNFQLLDRMNQSKTFSVWPMKEMSLKRVELQQVNPEFQIQKKLANTGASQAVMKGVKAYLCFKEPKVSSRTSMENVPRAGCIATPGCGQETRFRRHFSMTSHSTL